MHGFEGRAFAARVTRCGNGVQNDLFLKLAFFAVGLEATEGGDDGFTFGVAASGQEPARRFREPDEWDDEDKGEDNLEGDGKTPYKVWRSADRRKSEQA
ncbi:MAG: hypothetical protein L6R35_005052 [Caloplaca aegaea]|nr:MAG: hypothetical protein L6R35_005052 [Caloplaca aegaea]